MKEIDVLMESGKNGDVGGRLYILATLAEAWQEKVNPLSALGPIEAIRYGMERHGMRARDLQPYLGSRAVVASVLRGRRPLTPAMIRGLHQGLGISL
jgi:HTH-type transcriptional regulator / antitoxin HigA